MVQQVSRALREVGLAKCRGASGEPAAEAAWSYLGEAPHWVQPVQPEPRARMGVRALHLQQGLSNKYHGISLSHSMVFKGYRKPLEIEDVWELRDKDKTKALYTPFEKNMKSAMQKARAELEKRKRKKKRREVDTDYGNGMSKAQSQDVLVLVNPCLLLALCETETSRSQGAGSPHLPAALFGGFSLL